MAYEDGTRPIRPPSARSSWPTRPISTTASPRVGSSDPPRPRRAAATSGPDAPAEDLIWQIRSPSASQGLTTFTRAQGRYRWHRVFRSPTWFATAWGTAPVTFTASPTCAAGPTVPVSVSPLKDWGGQLSPSVWPRSSRCLNRLREAWATVADTIVLAGNVGVEQAAKAAGVTVEVPFTAGPRRCKGRTDRCRELRCARASGRRVPQLDGRRTTPSRPKSLMLDLGAAFWG